MHAVTGAGRMIAGRYQLQDPIGRGAMGIVWQGRDELLARPVAIKEVQISALSCAAEAETSYQRTLREARTAARLSHPGVVTVFDVLEEDGSPWIIMELVDARSLDRVVAQDGPLPPLQAAHLGASLVSALATAHEAGVLHRDVKPSNVLVGSDGRVVLTDFGIATFAGDPGITGVGMVVGTPGFTAPERLHGSSATPASDLWSVGATLYAAVEGRGPFDRVGGALAITTAVAAEEAPRAPSAGPLAPVIAALLSRDPATRPDASAAANLLAEAVIAARTGRITLLVPSGGAGGDDSARAGAGPAEPGVGAGPAEPGVPALDGAFLDPPVFAALSMAGGAGTGPGTGAGGRTGAGRLPRRRSGMRPQGRDAGVRPAGRWRLAAAGAGILALVIAAAIGLAVYARPPNPQALRTPGAAATGQAGQRTAGAAGLHHGRGSPAPGTSAAATVAHGQADSTGPSRAPSGGATSGSASPAPVPTASTPGSPVPVLPAGWVWQRYPAATLGSAAGFRIGTPGSWTRDLSGQVARFTEPDGGDHLSVSVAAWSYPDPLAEARYLQRKFAAADHGYTLLALSERGFEALGGYRGAPAAELKFSWHKPGAGGQTELVVLVRLTTTAGAQPYALTVWAPSAGFGSADNVLATALPTFRPLPAR